MKNMITKSLEFIKRTNYSVIEKFEGNIDLFTPQNV